MTEPAAIAAAWAAILTLVLARRHGFLTPLTISLALWAATLAISSMRLLPLVPLGGIAFAVIMVGLTGLALPGLVSKYTRRSPVRRLSRDDVDWYRFMAVGALLAIMVVIGVLRFRGQIELLSGASFQSLTVSQIRAVQSTKIGSGGGLGALMFSAAPLLACWGLIGARIYAKVYLVATAGAVASTLISPSRTTLIQLALTGAIFASYLWRSQMRTMGRPALTKVVPLLAAIGLGAILLSYFNSTSATLGKAQAATNIYHGYGLPDHLISPVLYTIGGLSALTVAINAGFDPLDRYGSIFSLIRVWRGVDPSVTAPDTVGRFVPIPGPFNVYTGFGQAYFDFGLVGAFLFPALVASVVVFAHRRALLASPRAMLVASVSGVAAINMLLENTFFNLGVSFQLVLGYVLFGWLTIRDKEPQEEAQPPNENSQTAVALAGANSASV